MRDIRRVLVGSWAMVHDSASTSNVKEAAALYPSGQVMGWAESAKAGNSMVRYFLERDGGRGRAGYCLRKCCLDRLRSGACQKLAVNPGAKNCVTPGAAEPAGEPGQVPAAQSHGDGALHCGDQPVHEQPGGEN